MGQHSTPLDKNKKNSIRVELNHGPRSKVGRKYIRPKSILNVRGDGFRACSLERPNPLTI